MRKLNDNYKKYYNVYYVFTYLFLIFLIFLMIVYSSFIYVNDIYLNTNLSYTQYYENKSINFIANFSVNDINICDPDIYNESQGGNNYSYTCRFNVIFL